jgi:hypothetical protein
MPEEYEGMEVDGAGVETAVAELEPEVPETPAEPETPETPEPEPEKTPEQIEEHKRLTGSARAKAKAERLAQENQQLQEQLTALKAKVNPQAAKPVEQAGEPKLEDFATFAEYNNAAIDYRVQKVIQEREAKQHQTQVIQSWEQKKAEARKTIPDFDEVLADMNPPAPVVLAVMNESPFTAQIAHYLGNHPDEAAEINKMTPAKAALAIGEIAVTFKAPKPEKKETKAPPPLVPVKAAAVVVKNDRHSGLEEF